MCSLASARGTIRPATHACLALARRATNAAGDQQPSAAAARACRGSSQWCSTLLGRQASRQACWGGSARLQPLRKHAQVLQVNVEQLLQARPLDLDDHALAVQPRQVHLPQAGRRDRHPVEPARPLGIFSVHARSLLTSALPRLASHESSARRLSQCTTCACRRHATHARPVL